MPSWPGNWPEGVTTREYELNESTLMNPVHCGETSQLGSAGSPAMAKEIVYSSWRHEVARKDGDIIMLTDNKILVENIEDLPTLMCIQRKAAKVIPTEEDIVRSNIVSFGNDIGKITNRVTSMYEIQSHFSEDSREYKTLAYRIMAGQHFQQASINISRAAW